MSSSFTYSPLDPSRHDSFRLLDILPGAFDAPIKCTLTHDLRDTPGRAYEALSYTWGDRQFNKTIFINRLPFSVTENLEQALRNLRDNSINGRARTIWVDAICIDQSEVQERNHQVGQMQQIYADAERVVIWLGPASEDSDIAIQFMESICHRLEKWRMDGLCAGGRRIILNDMGYAFTEAVRYLGGHEYDNAWLAVSHLLQRSWWERAWVVQELASSQIAIFYCGTSQISWPVLCLTIRLIGTENVLRPKVYDEFGCERDRAWVLASTRRSFRDKHIDLVDSLHQIRRFSCQDPRDKVFAVIGLANRSTRATFRADYTDSPARVYTMAFRSSIISRRDLEVLILIDHLPMDLTFPSLDDQPSWVADLQRQCTTMRFNKFYIQDRPYNTLKDSPPSFSEDSRLLYVDGFCVDVLEEDNVQQTEEGLHKIHKKPFWSWGKKPFWPWDKKSLWSWDIDAMIARIISKGGFWNRERAESYYGADGSSSHEDLHQSLKRALYDVIMAGQLFTRSGWQEYLPEYNYTLESESARAESQTKSRTVVFSKKGYLGLAPKATRVGDYIFILFGLQEPAILRKQDDGSYLFVGTAYVHGIMKEEALKGLEDGVFTKERVTLR